MSLFKKKSCCCSCGGSETGNSEKATENILILGGGCANCNALEDNVKKALADLNIEEEVGHVTDAATIAAMGVMSTPALVIDRKVVSMGKVLTSDDVAKLLEKVRG